MHVVGRKHRGRGDHAISVHKKGEGRRENGVKAMQLCLGREKWTIFLGETTEAEGRSTDPDRYHAQLSLRKEGGNEGMICTFTEARKASRISCRGC